MGRGVQPDVEGRTSIVRLQVLEIRARLQEIHHILGCGEDGMHLPHFRKDKPL
jgi:hypothetical protein